jgi:cytokinin riboside 5'-monophosphate phosphoribohydrolase
MVFTYLVKMKLRTKDAIPTFLELIEPLRQHCTDGVSEPNTLSYEVHRDEACDRTIVIVERYKSLEDLEITHRSSEPFKKFCNALGPLDLIEEKTNGKYFSDLLPAVGMSSTTVGALSAPKGCLVFCGSRPGTRPEYVTSAAELGAGLARRGKTLVYGGGTVGVMGALATATAANNGRVQSVIPRALLPREVSGDSVGQVFATDTMAERKSIMFGLSDVVISLPGGIGTFDELLEVLTLFQLNAYRPKIGLLNVSGFYLPLIAMLEHTVREGFLEANALKYFVVRDTAEELLTTLLDDAGVTVNTGMDTAALASLSWTAKP